jgi:acetylornithine deacetylase/succinyl-diaminopimelate desuccinylase-like protein
LQGPVPDAVKAAARKLWGNVEVVDSLQFGSTDSRYLREIGIAAYGVDTAPGSLDDIKKGYGAHGEHERTPAKWLPAGTDFLREIVRELTR